MKLLVCEMCAGNDLIKEDGLFVCRNCGCKYSVDEAKKLLRDDEPIQVRMSEPVKIVNNDFESKLAEAEVAKQIYLEQGRDAVKIGNLRGFDAVSRYYSQAELVGANESKYWESLADFMKEGMQKALENREKFIPSSGKNKLINRMDLILNQAIIHAEGKDRERLTAKKELLISEYKTLLSNHSEVDIKRRVGNSILIIIAIVSIVLLILGINYSGYRMHNRRTACWTISAGCALYSIIGLLIVNIVLPKRKRHK